MSKILSIDDMLEAAVKSEMPGTSHYVRDIEQAATRLAYALADHLSIELECEANWEAKDLGGTCASFGPEHKGQPCPEVIHEGDEGGDWGDDEEPKDA